MEEYLVVLKKSKEHFTKERTGVVGIDEKAASTSQ
jgi:hypothetical protein